MTPRLTTKALDQEYDEWPQRNRNNADQRFGQHVCAKYGFDSLYVFFEEDRHKAYRHLRDVLQHYQA